MTLIVGCAAAATTTAGLLQVSNAVNIINIGGHALSTKGITPPAPGQPETVLLIGVDHRYGDGSDPGRTDTMLLMRIDDRSSTINALSIPRDLQVNIPGFGQTKINAAYADGGSNGTTLLVKTLKQNLFPALRVNHIFVTDFQSFANLITSIGCVYAPVDHRYYNHSIGMADLTTDYSSIDIQPGYQQLCGDNGAPDSALAFVRFRHNDSDLIRESRQQDFLQWAKGQFGTGKLFAEEHKLLRLFSKDVSSDKYFHSSRGLLELFNLALDANGAAIKSIPFPVGQTIPGTTNFSFDPSLVEAAYRQLMTPTPIKAGSSDTTPVTTRVHSKTGKHRRRFTGPPAPAKDMVADPDDGTSQTAALDNRAGIPVYYPQNIPDDYVYCSSISENCNVGYEPAAAYSASYPRHYTIRDTAGKRHDAYVMTLVQSSGGYADSSTGQFVTVQGTTWTDPPLLRGSKTVRVVRGRTLDIYSQAGKINVVAWRKGKAVYWINNTLQNAVPGYEMVSMAESFTRAKR